MTAENTKYKTGFVAVVGRPNVGKSTLINEILGAKVSITSRKAQTTRHRIIGVKTQGNRQTIYVDTPGMHNRNSTAIFRYLNKTAAGAVQDVDVVLFLVEAMRFNDEDKRVLQVVSQQKSPVILVVNKIDQIKNKESLLPFLQEMSLQYDFADIIPISAQKNINRQKLEDLIGKYLPEDDYLLFPDNQLTDKSERFHSAEVIREKLMRFLGEELPYSATVEIESLKKEKNIIRINAFVWVERDSQKGIVIGDKGSKLKTIGTEARKDLEEYFGQKVFIRLWVKVRTGWSDDERALRSFGYMDETEIA